MEPLTVADLRRALDELPDDAVVVEAASGQSLVDVDADSPGQVALLFLEATHGRGRGAVNTIGGTVHGALVQVGGDHYGDLRL